MKAITIPALSDLHGHYRQDKMIERVCPSTARYAGRTLAMPNTTPAIATMNDARLYHARLSGQMPRTDVLMSFKLTPETQPVDISDMQFFPKIVAGKLYPAGVTTNSSHGGITQEVLSEPNKHTWFGDLLDAMQECDLVLCLHGEMPDQEDPLEREPDFLPFVSWVLDHFPRLRVVLEHITTAKSVEFVREKSNGNLAATITAHHLFIHLGHVFGCAVHDNMGYGNAKLHPHLFCWPVAKRPSDRKALQDAALSGDPRFFLGSDTAPHAVETKETACGCAGVFTAPVLPEILVSFFEEHFGLDKINHFVAYFGDDFYRLPRQEGTIQLERREWKVPSKVQGIVPFLAERMLPWILRK